jgi:hypothetical protein
VSEWTFTVDEPLMGFLASYKRPWTKEAKRYCGFKGKVRLLATIAGVPDELSQDQRASITIHVTWKKRARVDTVNVYKALEDSVFHKDRRVLDGAFGAAEHTGKESAVVLVRIEGKQNVRSTGC